MKFVANRLFTDPDAAARKMVELANAVDRPYQDGRPKHWLKGEEPETPGDVAGDGCIRVT